MPRASAQSDTWSSGLGVINGLNSRSNRAPPRRESRLIPTRTHLECSTRPGTVRKFGRPRGYGKNARGRTRGLGAPRLNIRPARVGDVPAIQELIRTFADRKLMIRRSLGELYESIREFFVATDDDGQVIGCAALHVFWDDLAELKCLAVAESGPRAGRRAEVARGLLGRGAGAGDQDGLHAHLRRRVLREVRLPPGREDRAAAQDLERVRPLPALPELHRGRPDSHGRARARDGRGPRASPRPAASWVR